VGIATARGGGGMTTGPSEGAEVSGKGFGDVMGEVDDKVLRMELIGPSRDYQPARRLFGEEIRD
jgi:hypothetical protein